MLMLYNSLFANSVVTVELSNDEKIRGVLLALLPYAIILFDLFIIVAAIYGIVAFVKKHKKK